MKILSLNQDKGIGYAKKKGAFIHVSAIRNAFAELGHEVVAIDDPSDLQLDAFDTHCPQTIPFDMVYERYALGKVSGSRFASHHNIPHLLEVNAPLAEETARWRQLNDGDTYEMLERRLFSNAHHIIAVSPDTKRYSIERGANEHKVTVIPNGFDPRIFYPRNKDACKRRLNIQRDALVIGFHGRLRAWHRFEVLVDAIAQLNEEIPSVHLLTIGTGDYMDIAQGRLSRLEHTHFEWVDITKLGEFVGAYDVLPLMYDAYEPCYFSPLKLYEAMACGAVPVVPNVESLQGTVFHNKSGLVYENGQLINHIKQLLQDRGRLTRMSSTCIEQARSHTWRHVAEATLRAAELMDQQDD